MPFASINPTSPRTDPWNFHKKILRIDRVEKWPFFESAILNFFLQKKKNFASSPWKLVTNYVLEWMGLNFQYYDGLQPKIRAGIINEHECITSASRWQVIFFSCTFSCFFFIFLVWQKRKHRAKICGETFPFLMISVVAGRELKR